MVSIDGLKIKPNKKIIDDLEIQIIYVPLESTLGYKYELLVNVGDYVCIDTVLAKNIACDLELKSSVSGFIVGIEKKYIANGDLVDCLVIENDFKYKYIDKIGKKRNIGKISKESFIYNLFKMGITGMSGNDFPTGIKYDTSKKIDYLIVNGVECDVYSSSDSALMYNKPEEILEGIDAIMEIMNIKKAYIAINEKNDKVIKKLLRFINSYPSIKIYPITDAYPGGYERYLIKEITGRKYKKNPNECGVITDNVHTIYAIYEAIKYGKPVTERIVTIAGIGVKNPGNYLVKIGTSFSEIMLKIDGYNKKIKNPRLIAGGLMTGHAICCDDLIITKDLGCILVIDSKEERESICIKCGKCSEVCPQGLMPSMIINNPDMMNKLKIDKCIECGLCSYVCPAKKEVREQIRKLKESKCKNLK